ncbi:MAG: trimethylamine methyltransferase family protein, partial [Anaerolineae bacterium]|nr:trimethylamine methyltransferase family protein [Anaerolineae bacterium]
MKQIHAKIEILSTEEIEQIHGATLEVLATVGCHLPHRRVLDRLKAADAEVDYATARAKLPPQLVEEAIRHATGGRRITPDDKFRAGVLRGGHVGIS